MANEKRLIYENVLLKKLSRMIEYCKTDSKVNGLTALFQVGDAVMDCPTVDAVEVVRCKDCKHYEDHKRKIYENCVRDGRVTPMKPDDFCSYGERKNDERKAD